MAFSRDKPLLPLEITLSLTAISSPGKKASCDVDWGDGSISDSDSSIKDLDKGSGNKSHTYAIVRIMLIKLGLFD